MKISETIISGCYEIQPRILEDERGSFVKVFNYDLYSSHGLSLDLKEEYYSTSNRGVIRGLHFQVPPQDHLKVVYCVSGEVQDVLLDLRIGSPSYGMVAQYQLNAIKGNVLYIPSGIAHGFCVTSESAILVYKTSTVYSQDHDAGILYSSVGVCWPTKDPVLSSRDLSFPALKDFKSPFRYESN